MLNAYIYVIAALGCNMCDGAEGARRQHDLVVIDQRVLVYLSEYIYAGDVVADLALC